MPAFETHDLRQFAVLWSRTGQDRHGLPVVAQPVQVRCRWIERDNQVVDPQGNTVQSSGSVTVDGPVVIGSIVRQGKLRDLPDPIDSLNVVIGINGTPDIKNRNVRTDLTLMRYSNKLPTVLT